MRVGEGAASGIPLQEPSALHSGSQSLPSLVESAQAASPKGAPPKGAAAPAKSVPANLSENSSAEEVDIEAKETVDGGACIKRNKKFPCPFEHNPKSPNKVKIAKLGVQTLGRVTNMNNCRRYEKQGKLEPSARGIYGAGIYFAATCRIGHKKMDAANRDAAASEGGFCCITAQVKMEGALMPTAGVKFSWLDWERAQKMKGDSVWCKRNRVHADRLSPPEFMIFKTDQVLSFKIAEFNPRPLKPFSDDAHAKGKGKVDSPKQKTKQ